MLADIRYALRQLRKSPGFAVTAVLTLALGIGATTAIFTLVHAVLLKSLPVTKPEQLYRIGDRVHCCGAIGYTQDTEFSLLSYDLYRHFRDQTKGFASLAAFQAGNTALGMRRVGSTQPAETHNGQFVTGNFFSTLGVGAWMGRVLMPSDDREGAAQVAVMSYHLWQAKYGGDPAIVGSTFEVNGKPFTLVGVAAPGFYGANLRSWGMPEVWIPVSAEPLIDGTESRLKVANANWMYVMGRVRPGADPKTIEAELRVELRQWLMSHAADMAAEEKQMLTKQTVNLRPGASGIPDMQRQYKDDLHLLLAAAGCVLLIACANLANLLLARGLARRQETSVRMALGASRSRLVRKALMESMLLGLLGGAAGLGLAFAGTTLILHLAFPSTQQNYVPIAAAPSWPVLLFALGVSLATGICFGIAPAWMTSHAEPAEALRGANRARGAQGGARAALPQKALVVAQVGLSLVLLSAAVMLAESLRNLEHQDFGFQTADRYLAWIDPQEAGYKAQQLAPLYREIQTRLEQIPGVRGAGEALYAPMSGDSWNMEVTVEGKPVPRDGDEADSQWARIGPGFFRTIGDAMVMGRPVTEEDTASSRRVAVINQAFAKRFFKDENPLGRHFGVDGAKHAGDYEVVGVAADTRYRTYGLKDPVIPMYFVPETQTVQYAEPATADNETSSLYLQNIVLWAPGKPANLETEVRRALADVDPKLTLIDFQSYDDVLRLDFSQQEMIARLTSLFGVLALLLAAIGLYGVMAYMVEQRTGEIGIRMALGADRLSVVRMVLRSAVVQLGIGLALGIPAAIAAGHAMASDLFGVRSYDPLILAAVAVVLAMAAFAAAALPARRAASVDPMVALRSE